MSQEMWRELARNDKYAVSNMGRVRGPRAGVMKPFVVKSTGYLQVDVAGKRASVHRLVCEAFLGDGGGLWVNHKNGIRDDNRAENLEWATPAENIRHGFRVLGRLSPNRRAVVARDIKTGEEITYACAKDAVREGFIASCISKCCNGICATHAGKTWRFLECVP